MTLHARLIAEAVEQLPAERELMEAWRAVANAKLNEFRHQAWRLAILARQGLINKAAALDRLWMIATAHALVRALGEDRVQAILSEAFSDDDNTQREQRL
jgi:hypothetical protein